MFFMLTQMDENFTKRDEIFQSFRERLSLIETDLEYHKETQASIIASQKQIRVEMDDLLIKQEYIDSKFKLMSNELVCVCMCVGVCVEGCVCESE